MIKEFAHDLGIRRLRSRMDRRVLVSRENWQDAESVIRRNRRTEIRETIAPRSALSPVTEPWVKFTFAATVNYLSVSMNRHCGTVTVPEEFERK